MLYEFPLVFHFVGPCRLLLCERICSLGMNLLLWLLLTLRSGFLVDVDGESLDGFVLGVGGDTLDSRAQTLQEFVFESFAYETSLVALEIGLVGSLVGTLDVVLPHWSQWPLVVMHGSHVLLLFFFSSCWSGVTHMFWFIYWKEFFSVRYTVFTLVLFYFWHKSLHIELLFNKLDCERIDQRLLL